MSGKIVNVNDINYLITNSNDMIQKYLCENKQWNKGILDIILELINQYNLKHFLNIGSHIGTVCLPISRHIEKVTAIEAHPITYKHLVKNIKLNNNITNIESFNIAIGDNYEDVYFMNINHERVKNNSGGMHVLTDMDIKHNIRSAKLHDTSLSLTVKMNRLDDLEIDNFDIMLVDIEGMEARFLKGATEKIKKNMPIIIIEIWDNNKRKEEKMLTSREDIINYILNLGYKLYKNIDDDFVFLNNI